VFKRKMSVQDQKLRKGKGGPTIPRESPNMISMDARSSSEALPVQRARLECQLDISIGQKGVNAHFSISKNHGANPSPSRLGVVPVVRLPNTSLVASCSTTNRRADMRSRGARSRRA
jgi:hypothetical protein